MPCRKEVLRRFSETHIDEDCSNLTGNHENALFFNCTLCSLSGLTLKNCDLNRSKFTTDQIRDALGFTLTLDCNSFSGVEFPPLLFDLLMVLAITTRGNDEKRAKLFEVV